MQVLKALKKVAAIGTGVAMLGATLTGAMALDLADYPAPFVDAGAYDDSNVFVVGAAAKAADSIGVADITSSMQFESKTCQASGGTVTVSGGITEDVPLGWAVASNLSTSLDQELEDDDIDTMFDGEITFKSTNYDARDILAFGLGEKFLRTATSLTSAEDDYQTDVVMELDVSAIRYYYVFDEKIQPNLTTSSDPLELKFLGKTLRITEVASTANDKFTARVGTEYFMDVGDSVEVEGKTVTLDNVGESGSVVVDVDGVKEPISTTTPETVNGVEIQVDETFYETTKAQRSATLIIGTEAVETYDNDDAYVGEDKDDPDWVWQIGNLNSYDSTTTSLTAAYSTGPYLGIRNKFSWNDDSDNPAGVGECIDLPNNYLRICFDSLTVADSDYKTYTFEMNLDSNLENVDGASDSADALYIHTNQPEGMLVDTDNFEALNSSSKPKTDKVWVYDCINGSHALEPGEVIGFYYEDTNGKVQIAGCTNKNYTQFMDINYENTKGSDIPVWFERTNDILTTFNITLVPYDSTDLPNYDDNITMLWTHSNYGVSSLGATASSEEASELYYQGVGSEFGSGVKDSSVPIGTKDEDHRTQYGVIIRDPKSHGGQDQVVLEIPNDQVQANIVAKGTAAVTAGGEESCQVVEITPVTKLDTEVAGSEANYNLILVGGPCVNTAIAAVPGLGMAACEDWTLKTGEGIIKLAANGDKVAMLVAGTVADDTRRAAKVIANYKDYTLSGTEVTVKGTTINEATVE